MNFVFISPHFPENYFNFVVALKKYGINVLGIADADFYSLKPELRNSLTEYFKVDDLHNYDQIVKACGFFTYKYGKIDRIESLNEYWLETDAKLRTDFNVKGFKLDQIDTIKCKSEMKKVFIDAGVNVARGKVVNSVAEAKKFIKEVGYPVVAKPDKGVGAADTFKIKSDDELNRFFEVKPNIDYIMEEFIAGDICSFDGLTDKEGNLLFYTGHQYERGIMDVVNEDTHVYYYSYREIPEDMLESGLKILKAFNVRERFFHFEFFRLHSNNQLVALEVNMRPPGGITTDMFNFACDFDIYHEYANVVVNNQLTSEYVRKFHVCYIGRKFNKNYTYSHEEVLNKYPTMIVHHQTISSVLAGALGNYTYIVRAQSMEPIFEAIDYIQKLS